MKKISVYLSLLLLPTATFGQGYGSARGMNGAKTAALVYDPALIPFYHGVASGDPTANSVIIWTRVTPSTTGVASIAGTYEVANDTGFTTVVKSGAFSADSSKDYTVKIDVTGLSSGGTFYYRFKATGRYSLVGRAKTLPVSGVNHLKFAVVSCSNYEGGYFNAYRRISERNDLDAVVHLGDYTYEYARGSYGINNPSRQNEPANEEISLQDYRTRYSLYRLDKDLIRLHQQHPFITVWDDHEFANDAYDTSAENHQPATEGAWTVRTAAAKKAYFEWIPIRDNTAQTVSRKLSYGNLCDWIMLDTREEGRTRQPQHFDIPDAGATARSMMTQTQMDWFLNNLKTTTATWKLVGNQTIFSQLNVGFAAGFADGSPDPTNYDSVRAAEDMFIDAWDGYPGQRKMILDTIKYNGVNNVVFATGDSHSSWGFDIAEKPVLYPVPAYMNIPQPNPYNATVKEGYTTSTQAGSFAVEFAAPSISSANFSEIVGPTLTAQFQTAINQPIAALGGANYNPQLRYVDLGHHGYYIMDVKPDSVHADYYFVARVDTPSSIQTIGGTLKTVLNSNKISVAYAPAPAKASQDVPTPVAPQAALGVKQSNEAITVFSVYPNPASAQLRVHFGLAYASTLEVSLMDITGRKVATMLQATKLQGGLYDLDFSIPVSVPAGSYVLEMKGAGFSKALPVTVSR